jgi:hypothetical protein
MSARRLGSITTISAPISAGARLAPAHDHGQQEQDGQLEVVGVRRDVFFRIRVQAAGQAGETGADDEGVHLVAVDRHAHAVGGDRAVAQRFEGAPRFDFSMRCTTISDSTISAATM